VLAPRLRLKFHPRNRMPLSRSLAICNSINSRQFATKGPVKRRGSEKRYELPNARTYVNSAVKGMKDQNLRYRLQAAFIIIRRAGSGQVSAALRHPFTPLNLITGTSVSPTFLGFTSLYIVPRYYGSFASTSGSISRTMSTANSSARLRAVSTNDKHRINPARLRIVIRILA